MAEVATTTGVPARAAAARTLIEVLEHGRTLEAALALHANVPGDRATVQALSYGSIRWYWQLQAWLAPLLQRPWAQQPSEVQAVLLLALYQLEHAAVPTHAAVATAVDVMRALDAPHAAGFINAILRRWLRERGAGPGRNDSLAVRTAHPDWLVAALKRAYGPNAAGILAANNQHPPLWLRVNTRKTTRDEYRELLQAAGHTVETCDFAPEALCLAQPVDVTTLPGFSAGLVAVQDAAAQLAPQFLAAGPGMRVLDACAAPGGKACHLLETVPSISELVAVESDPARVRRLQDNLQRLGLEAQVLVADAAVPGDWWDGRAFDRVLLDVPCSGTGVIRRHPDIKVLRRPGDIGGFVAQQERLLRACWPLLRPGGRLVYASCSILPSENSELIARFLDRTAGAVDSTDSVRLALMGSVLASAANPPGFALLPGTANTDGFYYACLDKLA